MPVNFISFMVVFFQFLSPFPCLSDLFDMIIMISMISPLNLQELSEIMYENVQVFNKKSCRILKDFLIFLCF